MSRPGPCMLSLVSRLQGAEYCQQEMSRAVRLALWDYKVGAPLTTVCDADVQDKCPAVSFDQ